MGAGAAAMGARVAAIEPATITGGGIVGDGNWGGEASAAGWFVGFRLVSPWVRLFGGIPRVFSKECVDY